MIEVTYKPCEPQHIGGLQTMYGTYSVRYEDGWTVMLAHTGTPGTVSEQPLEVADPETRDALIAQADRFERRPLRAEDHFPHLQRLQEDRCRELLAEARDLQARATAARAQAQAIARSWAIALDKLGESR